MDLLEIKKQHVSAYHWPPSGLILKYCCKSVIQLLQTRIGVWIPSPTRLIRYRLFYQREVLILSGCGISPQLVRCGWGGA